MADTITVEERSALMSRIRSKNTTPEVRAYELLRAALPRHRIDLHAAHLPGSPDLFVPSLRLAVIVDGCFWHGCPKHYRAPTSRTEYWWPKIEANIRRDRRADRRLRAHGISRVRIWEHDLRRGASPLRRDATSRRS
jgi:DNA mismatch endonuclease, patch repair protein